MVDTSSLGFSFEERARNFRRRQIGYIENSGAEQGGIESMRRKLVPRLLDYESRLFYGEMIWDFEPDDAVVAEHAIRYAEKVWGILVKTISFDKNIPIGFVKCRPCVALFHGITKKGIYEKQKLPVKLVMFPPYSETEEIDGSIRIIEKQNQPSQSLISRPYKLYSEEMPQETKRHNLKSIGITMNPLDIQIALELDEEPTRDILIQYWFEPRNNLK